MAEQQAANDHDLPFLCRLVFFSFGTQQCTCAQWEAASADKFALGCGWNLLLKFLLETGGHVLSVQRRIPVGEK